MTGASSARRRPGDSIGIDDLAGSVHHANLAATHLSDNGPRLCDRLSLRLGADTRAPRGPLDHEQPAACRGRRRVARILRNLRRNPQPRKPRSHQHARTPFTHKVPGDPSLIGRCIAWRNRHAQDRMLREVVKRANVA